MLDLLGKMEGQVGRIEGGGRQAPPRDSVEDTLGAFQTRLASELNEIRALREEMRSAEKQSVDQLSAFTTLLENLKAQLPEMVEENISARLLEIEERFHSDLKDAHDRSIDAFLQGLNARVGQRISDLETGMAMQIDAMAQLHEYHVKTGRNVQRLLHGLDRLTAELSRLAGLAGAPVGRRITAALQQAAAGPDPFEPRPMQQQEVPPQLQPHARRPRGSVPQESAPREDDEHEAPRPHRHRRPAGMPISAKVVIALVFLGGPIGIGYYLYTHPFESSGFTLNSNRKPGLAPAPLTGVAAQLKTASDFAAEKNYSEAEALYRTILKSETNNRDAIKGLADVLFKQQRYEEAAAILKTLPADK
jgi:uncharacterized coiled-coil protein SlyX